jgi:tetratricopeptide (TPR) repeat protein
MIAQNKQQITQIADLLKQGNLQQSVEAYRKQVEQFDLQTQQWLNSWFGLCLLSGYTELLECDFPDTAIINDYAFARQALDAYCQNQETSAVQLLLRKLSYDSPYKDFRLIVSTLLDIDDAPACLTKLGAIAQSSPYHQIVELIGLAIGHMNDPIDPAEFNQEIQQFIAALRSHDSASDQQLLVEILTPQLRFEWLMEHSNVVDATTAQSMLLNLLVDYPQGMEVYQSRFGELADLERLRLQALASERSGDWDKAAGLWEDCLEAIDLQQLAQGKAMQQLISQRAIECKDHDRDTNPQQQVSILEQRIQKNPDDSETCLKLLAHYRTTGDEESYRDLVKQAIVRFPQHPVIVATAVENATETVEFEDAARLAGDLLETDALNQETRRLLIQAYMSYADKLALRGQRYATQTILDQAEALERPKPSGVVALHRALMHYVVGEESKAEQQVELGCTQLGSYLNGYTQMVAETARLGFKKKYTKQYHKLIRSLAGYQPDAEEIVTLMRLLHDYTSDSRIDSHELLSVLRPFLHQSLEGNYSNDQLRLICTTLDQMNAYEDLHRVALSASQRNQKTDAEFEYLRILGITRGDPAQINSEDSIVLEHLLDRLAEENPQLRARITEFLNANLLPGSTTLASNIDQGISPTTQNNTDMSFGTIVTTIKRLFNQ